MDVPLKTVLTSSGPPTYGFGRGPKLCLKFFQLSAALACSAPEGSKPECIMQFSQRGSRPQPFSSTPYLVQSTFEHFLVTVIVAVGHDITRRFPAANIVGG